MCTGQAYCWQPWFLIWIKNILPALRWSCLIFFVYFYLLQGFVKYLIGFVFINRKRGSDEQSTSKTQDQEIEKREAENTWDDTLKKLKDLEDKRVLEDIDEGKPVRPRDFATAKTLEEQYPSFFDEDSGNSNNKKQGYNELKDYLEEELNIIHRLERISINPESSDRESKRSKPMSSDYSSEGKEISSKSNESEGKDISSKSDESESKGKEISPKSSESVIKGENSLIDDFADPNTEFGDWTSGDD